MRPEPRSQELPKPFSDGPSLTVPLNDRTSIPSSESRESQISANSTDGPRTLREGPQQNGAGSKEMAQPRPSDQPSIRTENIPVMPPPAVPSQTASAQELRETAKQTMGRSDRPELRNQNGAVEHSSRPRSSSPLSHPGTRNHSNDSRTSGGKDMTDVDRGADDRRSEREGRHENRESNNLSRRDSLTHTRTERRDRGWDGEKDKDNERDKDRGRDRHSERERDKERDRDHRERDREREREREREKDRDRHRRDDKDRDRDSRKEREGATSRSQGASPVVATEDHSLQSRQDAARQDPSRRRDNPQTNGDENLGKRRRPVDDEVCAFCFLKYPQTPTAVQSERASKRSSRKESHRDDRGRRPPEKERDERGRDSDRRRKEREVNETESRASPTDKVRHVRNICLPL